MIKVNFVSQKTNLMRLKEASVGDNQRSVSKEKTEVKVTQ
jgi:hypothetical protein